MTTRDRRALAIGGVLLLSLFVLQAVPRAARAFATMEAEVDARGALLVRMRDAVAGIDALTDSADMVRREFLGLAPHILTGDSEAEALASFTGHLTAIADRSRATLERADALPDSTRMGELRRITVRASFEGDTRGMVGVLRGIDTGPMALATGAVRIVAPDPASPDIMPEVLKGEIVIHAWYIRRRSR